MKKTFSKTHYKVAIYENWLPLIKIFHSHLIVFKFLELITFQANSVCSIDIEFDNILVFIAFLKVTSLESCKF